ncbi:MULTISPECIES: COG1361 family protein [Kitasatospora]|uniref:Peptidase n=1 Tax=Kitasatospora cystarginea TaxID=58350 RepID=A0ABN3EXQ9_9ACTN
MLCCAGLGPAAQAGAAAEEPDRDVIGIQLLEAPVDRRSDPRALRYIVDHLPPGTTIQRQARIVNKSPKPQHIEVYPGAATVTDEQFRFGAAHASNELTSWVSLDRRQLDLQPHSDARVEVSVQVPSTAAAGERYAVIWASASSSPNPSANITQINRVGIRMYLDIGPGGEPSSDFAIGELTPARAPHGQPSLSIHVRNTGGRALDMTGSVSLSEGPAGMRAGPFEVGHGTTLAPGEPGTVTVAFPNDLPNGPWKIDVNLASGLVSHTGTGHITFPDAGTAGHSSSLLSHLPAEWILVGGPAAAGLAVLGGLAVPILRSWRRRRESHESSDLELGGI